jgi:hypothetical protein
MSDPSLDSTRNLAKWLQEAGQRKAAPAPAQAEPAARQAEPRRTLSVVRGMSSGRVLALAAVTALAYLQYFFTDALLQISSLPYVVFFLRLN